MASSCVTGEPSQPLQADPSLDAQGYRSVRPRSPGPLLGKERSGVHSGLHYIW